MQGLDLCFSGGFDMPSLRIVYSTISATDIAMLASELFPIGPVVSCWLHTRGFNDTYALHAESGERYVLRLGARRSHCEIDFDYEVAFLRHLAAMGVPVAPPIAGCDGRFWKLIRLPERERPVLLFRFLEGHSPRSWSMPEARAQARTLAHVHMAGKSFVNPPERFKLDLDHLVRGPVTAVTKLPAMNADSRAYLKGLAAELIREVGERAGLLSICHCHGDCHGSNVRITSGASEPIATLFDFDDGGPGFLAYDLAVYLWSTVLTERRHLWPSFIERYQEAYPISAVDLDAIPLFVAIRHLWLMGEYATRSDEWGVDWLDETWRERQLDFLRQWEENYLSKSRLI
jgi:Ser/Thr protein kinase RdoA (MazF antagonist)